MNTRFGHLLPGPAAVVLLLLAASPATATFNKAVSVTQSSAVTSGTLAAPAGPFTGTCKGNGSVTLGWTASTSTYATGYTVSWTGTPSGSTTSTTNSAALALTSGNTYSITVTTTFKSWTSKSAYTANFTC